MSGTLLGAAICGDTDSDGVADGTDNCDSAANPLQEDFDGDGMGYVCDNTCAGSMNFNHLFGSGAAFTIEANQSIQFSGAVASGANVILGAAQSVVLGNGTSIDGSASFQVRQQGCGS